MVVYDSIAFPASSSPTILVGTGSIPYGSTDGVNRSIQINTPVGFSFRVGALVSPNAQTITATISAITSVAVYKNGVSLTTQSLFNPFPSIAKSYTLGSATGIVSFNSYMQQLTFNYVPTTLPAANTTDTYTFYATFSYTLSSTKSGAPSLLTSTGAGSIVYGIIANTTTSTSSFSQMSYAAGSSNSTGYAAYSIQTPFTTGDNWSVTNAGYVPAQNNSLWTGFYTIATLYARNAYFTENIYLKNAGSSPTITWLQADGSAGSLAYASLLSNAFNFNVQTALTNGFKFLYNGAEVASISTAGVITSAGKPLINPVITSTAVNNVSMSSANNWYKIATDYSVASTGIYLMYFTARNGGYQNWGVSIGTTNSGDNNEYQSSFGYAYGSCSGVFNVTSLPTTISCYALVASGSGSIDTNHVSLKFVKIASAQ